MPFEGTLPRPLLFCPPLDSPLVLKTGTGRYGNLKREVTTQPGGVAYCVSCEPSPLLTLAPNEYAKSGLHEGVDLGAPAGTCVYSIYEGLVKDASGGSIIIDHNPHGMGIVAKYLHVQGILVNPGDSVSRGQVIAKVDALPGTQDHLHFEVHQVINIGPVTYCSRTTCGVRLWQH